MQPSLHLKRLTLLTMCTILPRIFPQEVRGFFYSNKYKSEAKLISAWQVACTSNRLDTYSLLPDHQIHWRFNFLYDKGGANVFDTWKTIYIVSGKLTEFSQISCQDR